MTRIHFSQVTNPITATGAMLSVAGGLANCGTPLKAASASGTSGRWRQRCLSVLSVLMTSLAAVTASAAVDVGAAAIQSGYWLGLNQYFYNSGWDEHVGFTAASAGQSLADAGAFAVSGSVSSSHGLYLGEGLALTRETPYSATSLADFALQGSTRDVIQVVSDSLPIGTLISIEYRLYLAATAVPGVQATLTLAGGPAFIRIDGGSGAPPEQFVTRQIDDRVRVGDTLLVDSGFRLKGGAENRGPSTVNALSLGSFSMRAACLLCAPLSSLGAAETGLPAALGFDVPDSRVSLVAASGHNYRVLVVPEPQTYALMLLGLAGLCIWVQRNRRQGQK